MSKVNYITIKNKQSGFTRTLGEPEFNGMIDKTDYDIVDTKKTESSSPDNTWTNAKIREYLDGFRKREFSGTDLNRVLKTQQLVKELSY